MGDYAAQAGAAPYLAGEMERPVNNTRLIAELQAVTIAIRLVGLRRLPDVMRRAFPETLPSDTAL